MSDEGPPQQLNANDISYDIVDVSDDGWCLYRAYWTAWGIANQLPPPTDDNIYEIVSQLSQGLVSRLQEPQIFAAVQAVAEDVINGAPDEKGYATQVIENDPIKPYIERNGNRFTYVKTEKEYAAALAIFRVPDNFNAGPLIWPDLQVIGLLLTNPHILLYDISTNRLANNFIPNLSSPEEFTYLILSHTGGNHYKYVLPTAPSSLSWYYKGDPPAGGAGAGGSSPYMTHVPSRRGSLNSTSSLVRSPAAAAAPALPPLGYGTTAASTSGAAPQSTADDTLTMDQIKQYLKDLSDNPDPRAKKLQIILGSILLINAVRERKLKRQQQQPQQQQKQPPAEKKAAIGDIAGRMAPIKPTRGMIEGAFNALGGFGKKAAALLQRKSKPVVPIRTGVDALRRTGQPDFSRAPGAVQRIVRQPTGPYIQAGVGPTAPKQDTKPLIPDLPEFKAGSIVTTYIKVKDKLLIHRRAKGSNEELTLSTPSGFVDASDNSYAEAAVRELKEESGLELQGENLTTLRVTQIDDKYMVAFYHDMDDINLLTLEGPQPEFAKELDMKYDFAGITGESAGPGHFWASIQELPKWLRTHKEFKNSMFYDNLVALMLHFPDEFTIPDDAANDVVYSIDALDQRLSWVPKKVFSSQDLKDTWLCQFEQTRVSPCEPWELRDALIAADKFKEHDRLGAHLATNPDIVEYREMTNRIKTLKEIMKGPHEDKDAEELRTLEKEFSDTYLQMRKVHVVRSMKPGDDYPEETFSVPNPVHALSYREDDITDFANPSGTPSKYDPSGTMMAMNTGVLKAIAYPEMIADKHMAVSILESLWHCAGDVSLSNDPRCFPARVLGQLREYEAARVQMDQQQRARDYMATRTAWPEIKRIIRAMKNALIGAQVVSFSNALAEKMVIPKPASSPVAVATSNTSHQGTSGASNPASASVAAAIAAIPAAIPSTTASTPAPAAAAAKPAAAKRPRGMPEMAHGVAVVIPVPRGIGAPIQSLLPTPLGASGR